MALQTTGLEFFYLSVDFFENDKILLVEQELGSRATLPADCPKAVRPIMYSKWWMHYWNVAFLVKSNTKDLEFLLRKAYRAIILRRHNDGSV